METSHPPQFQMEIRSERHVSEARFRSREAARRLGFSLYEATAIETAVSELASNIVRHAGRGLLTVRPWWRGGRAVALEVVARNLAPVREPAKPGRVGETLRGASREPAPGEGLGIGLSGVRRLMDETRIEELDDETLQVVAVKWLPEHRPPVRLEPVGIVDVSPRWRVEAASRPYRAGSCADGYIVKEAGGRLLAALFDALGHGVEAAAVARVAREAMLGRPELDPADLLEHLHVALRGTRGMCAAVVAVEAGGRRVRWAGAGNVRLRLWHGAGQAPLYLPTQPGIVGYNLSRVTGHEAQVHLPARLLMVTDGVRDEALERWPERADAVIERFLRPGDDATAVLVAWDDGAEQGGVSIGRPSDRRAGRAQPGAAAPGLEGSPAATIRDAVDALSDYGPEGARLRRRGGTGVIIQLPRCCLRDMQTTCLA